MRANTRVFYNIVDLDNVEKGVQVYTSGIKILQDILAYFADPDWGDVTHPEHGYDIVIDREGTTRESTKYQVRARKNPTAVPNIELLSGLKNLDSFVKVVTYEQQSAIYEGMPAEEAEDTFQSSAPSSKPQAKAQPRATGTPVQAKAQPKVQPKSQPATAKEGPPAIGEEVGAQIAKATTVMPSCFGKFLDKEDPACQHCAVQKQCDEKMNPTKKSPVRQPVNPAAAQLGQQLNEE
jgi:hypothetical protein